MKRIASYSKPEEAWLAASVLEGSGIDCNVRDDEMVSAYWLASNAVGGVKLEVREEDYERARELLELPPPPEAAVRTCPHCGSSRTKLRELTLPAAFLIFFNFLVPLRSRKVDCRDCGRSFPLPPESPPKRWSG